MKSVKTASIVFMFLVISGYRNDFSPGNKLGCTLRSDKTNYKVGELPNLQVEIHNSSNKDIYLIGSLDGSIVQWRMPYCYFTIEKPQPDTIQLGLCGNLNTLKSENFKKVKAGTTFDPFSHGFFPNYTIQDAREFRHAGVYKLRFHYSTNSKNIDDFMGDGPLDKNRSDANELMQLLKQVPKVDLISNEIEITFGN